MKVSKAVYEYLKAIQAIEGEAGEGWITRGLRSDEYILNYETSEIDFNAPVYVSYEDYFEENQEVDIGEFIHHANLNKDGLYEN